MHMAQKKEQGTVIVFDNVTAERNIAKEFRYLSIRGRKLNIFLVFITRFCF